MKKTLLLLIVAITALLMSSVSFAGTPGNGVIAVNNSDIRCDVDFARFEMQFLDILESFQLDLYLNGVLAQTQTVLANSTVDVVDVPYNRMLDGVTEIAVYFSNPQFDLGGGEEIANTRQGGGDAPILIFISTIDCSNGENPDTPQNPVTRPTDGRFCFAPGQARAAVYAVRDASGGTGISIWAIDDKDKGEPVITLTAAQLREAASKSEPVVLLSQSLLNSIKFYQLRDANGKISYQINVGPVGELKVHECRFSSIPASDAKVTSYEPGK